MATNKIERSEKASVLRDQSEFKLEGGGGGGGENGGPEIF